MVHSDESRTGQQRKVLQGDTLRSFLANVGQSPLSFAQAPIPVVISIGIVRGAFPLAMGVASDDSEFTSDGDHRAPYARPIIRKHGRAPRLSCLSELRRQLATRKRVADNELAFGLTDLAGPIGRKP
jgi:hypothetical protein